jgi:rubredoxin
LAETTADTETQQWICEICGYVYDPAEGDPDGGIDPGTAFEDIPDDWFCPVCGSAKRDFRPLEPGEDPEEASIMG